ncbi:metallophosphoesterase family protein [Chloroflexota bacterium]
MTQTIVALSDTHEATLGRLPAALHDALASADLIVHAGDHTAMTVLEELRALGAVVAVAGNMDSTPIKISLPARQLFTFGGRKVGVAHGSGPPWGITERVRRLFPENPDLIIFGHSHVPFTGTVEGSYMVNPGPGRQSYAVIKVGTEIRASVVPL